MKYGFTFLGVLLLAGCAATTSRHAIPPEETGSPKQGQPNAAIPAGPPGAIEISVKNVLDAKLPAHIELFDINGNAPVVLEAPEGAYAGKVPSGDYRAYVHVYEDGLPILIDVEDLTVKENQTARLAVNLLEGAAGALGLRDFDSDGDLAIDRVELDAGTNPYDAAEIPGRAQIPVESRVLEAKPGWYRGELHAHSVYGGGSESVAELIKRAEKERLDFLAITDRNTLDAAKDPAFRSDKVALIPAMEWGDERGSVLIYGPCTVPDPPSTAVSAQADCVRIQAQGGVYAIAHPCFPDEYWQWGLQYVNAVEVWCRDWRSVPPITLEKLNEDMKEREEGKLVHPLASAAAQSNIASVSANTQATNFWDEELGRGLMAAAIGGSNSASPKVPLARPVTYVYARDKSVAAILEGLRMGRTVIASELNGPMIFMNADTLNDGKIDVGVGGVVPLGVDVKFQIGVLGAAGKKLQVLENGRPIRTVPIVKDNIAIQFVRHPTMYSTYRARIIGAPEPGAPGYDSLEVLAMTSPIYAQNITQELLWRNPNLDVDRTWVEIKADRTPEIVLPEE